MGDPEFRNDEKFLLRTPWINVKSIPFEGILTDQRVILVDRARNVLPPRDIPLATIRQVAAGENAIGDSTLTFHVAGSSGETRQMVLTFSREGGGNRARERDEWTRFLDYYIPRARPVPGEPAVSPVPPKMPGSPVPLRTDLFAAPKKRIIENAPPEAAARDTRTETPAPPAREAESAAVPASIFCIRCGNRVSSDSVFCNRCGTPIVPPAPSQYAAPLPPAPAVPVAPSPANVTVARPEPPVPEPSIPIRTPDPRQGLETVRITDDTPVRPPVRAPVEPVEREAVVAPRKSPVPAALTKPKKQGFIPRLFSPKARSASPKSESPAPQEPEPEKPRRRGGSRPWKKILLAAVAVVIVIAVIAVGIVVVYPMLSKGGSPSAVTPGESSSSASVTPTASPQGQSPSAQSTWAAVVPTATQTAVIPPTGVWVHVNYIGGFKGTYGLSSELQSMTGSGDRVYEILNATGPVQANFDKTDSSVRHPITVEIYKEGKLLTQGTTSAAYGKVALAADATTGIAQAPVTSASAGAVATSIASTPATNTTAESTPAINATAITTTAITTTAITTTVKTTAKAS